MEEVCKEVDKAICVDLENEEIHDIMEAVNIMMRRFVEALSTVNNEIKIDSLEFCGSMAERTRIWQPEQSPEVACDLEFDYLAVMKSWPGCGEFQFIQNNTSNDEGEMQITYEPIDPQSISGKRLYLPNDIKLVFIKMLLEGVKSQCKRNVCTRQIAAGYSSRYYIPGCKCCTVYMKTGSLRSTDVPEANKNKKASMLTFVWSSSEDHVLNPSRKYPVKINSPRVELSVRDKFIIHVDFHPVIEISKEKTDGTSEPFDDTYAYCLFPNGSGNVAWRISSCTLELTLLKNTSQGHKQAFRVLKFICKALRNCCHLNYVEAYEAKCITLNHIKSCKAPEKGTHLCLLEMVKDIHDCSQYMNLPHPYLLFNLFGTKRRHMNKVDVALCEAIFRLFDEQKEQYSTKCLIFDLQSLGIMRNPVSTMIDSDQVYEFVEKRRSTSAEEMCFQVQGSKFVFVHDGLKNLFPGIFKS